MRATIEYLSLLTRILALSSLLYQAFQEPLNPYMQGIAGGVIEVYWLVRDKVFAVIGWGTVSLVDFFARWLIWLPPTPWFTIPAIGKDLITAYFLIAASMISIRAFSVRGRTFYGIQKVFCAILGVDFDDFMRDQMPRWKSWIIHQGVKVLCGIFWPVVGVFVVFENLGERNTWDMRGTPGAGSTPPYLGTAVLTRIVSLLVGSTAFFVFVFAENKIGL